MQWTGFTVALGVTGKAKYVLGGHRGNSSIMHPCSSFSARMLHCPQPCLFLTAPEHRRCDSLLPGSRQPGTEKLQVCRHRTGLPALLAAVLKSALCPLAVCIGAGSCHSALPLGGPRTCAQPDDRLGLHGAVLASLLLSAASMSSTHRESLQADQ